MVSSDLDIRFRAAAVREGIVDVRYDVVDSPVGPLLAAQTDRGLARIFFSPDGADESLARAFGARVLRAPLDEVRRELDEYFDGRRHAFELALDLRAAPEFHQRVRFQLQRTGQFAHGRFIKTSFFGVR